MDNGISIKITKREVLRDGMYGWKWVKYNFQLRDENKPGIYYRLRTIIDYDTTDLFEWYGEDCELVTAKMERDYADELFWSCVGFSDNIDELVTVCNERINIYNTYAKRADKPFYCHY